MTMYSPLDNIIKMAELRDKIRLEEGDLIDSIEYQQNTGDTPVDDRDYKFLSILNDLLRDMTAYLGDQANVDRLPKTP